jgi:hypothetical protein
MGGPLTVIGGPGRIDADYLDLELFARLLRTAADAVDDALAVADSFVLETALEATAGPDPIGAAEVRDLAWVLRQPGAVGEVASRMRFQATLLTAAREAYQRSDGGLVATMWHAAEHLPSAGWSAAKTLVLSHSPSAAAQAFITTDPDLIDVVFDGAGGKAIDAAATAHLSDGYPELTDEGLDSDPSTGRAPSDLAGLITGLARRDAGSAGDIDVKIGYDPSGRRHVVVDIPGTKSMSLGPTPDVTSLETDTRALIGKPTAYGKGVVLALRAAGVTAADDVTLVGHSEGGLIAVEVAREAHRTGEFTVGHIVTAGSPIGIVADKIPRNVQVLALENRIDVVPYLDGCDNPARLNLTTATFTAGDHTVGGDHDLLESYLDGAVLADHSHDPSIVAFLRGLGPMFTMSGVTTHIFRITRRYH